MLLLPLGERHRAGDGLVSDVARRQHDLLAPDSLLSDGDGVRPVLGRDGAQIRVRHDDVGAAQWLTRLRRNTALDDCGLLRAKRRAAERYNRRRRASDEQRPRLWYAHKLPLVGREDVVGTALRKW